MVVHLSMDATILKKDSPEEVAQQEILKRKREEQEKRDAAEAVDVEIEAYEGEEARKNTLRNQFNFSERASQTYNEVQRYRVIATQPPRCNNFSEEVTQWFIYDAYMAEIEGREASNKKESDKPKAASDEPKKKASESDPIYSDAMKLSELYLLSF